MSRWWRHFGTGHKAAAVLFRSPAEKGPMMTGHSSSDSRESRCQIEPEPIIAEAVDHPADDDLRLAPPDCPSRGELCPQLVPPEITEFEEPLPPRFQFSLTDLMVIMLGVSVGLAGGTWMPADYFAGIMGLLVLGGLILVTLFPFESRSGWLAWGTFILAYVVAVITAAFKQVAQ
jgi:hypothetical protein